MNSILKRKDTKGSRNNHIKLYLTPNQETKIATKGPQRIDNIFLEKHDLDKTYKDSKIKRTQTQCYKNKKTARNTQNKPKTER